MSTHFPTVVAPMPETAGYDREELDELAWPPRVLIVDDAPATRRFLRAVLERASWFDVVGEADNGDGAVTMAADLQPDVVLLDVSMPGASGPSVLAELRFAVPQARIVFVSGSDEHLVHPLPADGSVGFLRKGLPPIELLRRLEELIHAGAPAETDQALLA